MCIRDRNTIYTVWEYIQMQQYNEALIALPIARKNWEGGQNAKVASPEERQQTLEAFGKIEFLLESKEYAALQQLLQKRIAVSYTHLDVYKRQIYRQCSVRRRGVSNNLRKSAAHTRCV